MRKYVDTAREVLISKPDFLNSMSVHIRSHDIGPTKNVY